MAVDVLLPLGESSGAGALYSWGSDQPYSHVWTGPWSGLLCQDGTFPQEPLSIAQTWAVSAVRGQETSTRKTGSYPTECSPGQDGASTWHHTPRGNPVAGENGVSKAWRHGVGALSNIYNWLSGAKALLCSTGEFPATDLASRTELK